MSKFDKLDFESLKKIEEKVFNGVFECDALRSSHDSSLNQRYYLKAVKYYSAWLKYEENKDVLLNLAASHFKLKQYVKTIQILTKAIELYPDDIKDYYIPTCFNLRAWAYCLSGNYEESIIDYTRCKEWDSSYHWCYFRGQAHFHYKHYHEAICDFSEVLKVQKHWSAQLYWRAKSYLKLKEYNKAIEDYTRLMDNRDESSFLYLRRGKAYKKLGEYGKAKIDFELANSIKNDTFGMSFINYLEIYYHLITSNIKNHIKK